MVYSQEAGFVFLILVFQSSALLLPNVHPSRTEL